MLKPQLFLGFFILAIIQPLISTSQISNVSLKWNVNDTTRLKCSNDTTKSIKTIKGIDVYQTYDDTWNGERDSTQCINLWRISDNKLVWEIDTQEFNVSKPLFINFT